MMYQPNAPLFGHTPEFQKPDYSSMKQSPLQGLAAALGEVGGAIIKKRKDGDKAKVLADALSMGKGAPAGLDPKTNIEWNTARAPDREAMAQILLGNEGTRPIAERMILGDMDRQQSLQDKIEETKALMPFEIQLARAKAQATASGSNGPAPIQITNDIMQSLQAARNAKTPEEKAQHIMRANILSQSAKMYDKGINAYGEGGGFDMAQIPGYGDVVGGIGHDKKAGEEEGKVTGKDTGEAKVELNDRIAQFPRLQQVTQELSDLGKTATYSMGGQAADIVRSQTGGYGGLVDPASQGAVARTEYISKVDNEILPLLRQTFGAQFTAQEGQSLKATLGDPNKTPQEKDAVLRSFIATKAAQIEGLQRKLGNAPTAPPTPSTGFKYLGAE
jgi:hypothetical protein